MRHIIKSAFSRLGLDVRLARNIPAARKQQKHEDLVKRWKLLSRYQPKTILDIGANEGQCAALLREAFPDVMLYSFEPLKDCFDKVEKFLSRNGPGKAFPFALGDQNGQESIHRNDFSPSSSLLPMEDLHRQEFPQTVNSTVEQIQVRRLDDVFDEMDIQYPLVIKADVQGYEGHVIAGGENVFRRASAAVLEVTSYSLYEGQATFESIDAQLQNLGFVFRGVVDQNTSQLDGRILQFDGLFENTSMIGDEPDKVASTNVAQGTYQS